MIPNRIINVIGNAGNRLTYESKTIRGNANYRDILTVITPATLSTVVIANYLLYDARNENITQYLVPSSLKGKDLIDPTHENYQDWAEWNVFEVSIHQNALAKISRHNKGKIGLSFNFVVKTADTRATNFIGYFGNEDVPASATEGDYYICELSTYISTNAGLTFNYGQYAIWVSGAWVKSASFTLIGNTSTKEISVDPSVVGIAPTVDDETSNDIYSELGSIQDRVTTAEADIDEVQQDIIDMKDGTDAFSEILLGTAQIRYNSTKKIVEQVFDDGTTLEVGLELWAIARNEDSTVLKNGEVAAINGVVGQQLSVVHADSSDDNLHFKELGVCTMDAGIAVNATGKITHFGEVNGIPIANFEVTGTPYAENQALYVSTNGKLTNVQPAKPITHIHAGWILRTIGSNANIFVYFVKVPHFDHLSDVIITTPTNGDIPILGSDGIWRNSQRLVTAESEITKIKDGTTTVKKAEQDKNGNDIVNTYETKSVVSEINNRVTSLETANMIKSYTYNPSTHVLTFTYFDNSTTSFDLPLESAIVGASYDNVTKDITFTLQSGATLVVPLDDLISGLASETWVTTYFIPKTALKTSFSATPLDTNVISEKLAKESLDLKEALANKKSVINDSETEYPNSKAVLYIGLDTKISALKNKTLREIFITNNLLSNSNFINTENWAVRPNTSQSVTDGINTITATNTYGTVGIQQTFTPVNGNSVYIVLKAKSDSVNTLLVYRGTSLEFVNIESDFKVKSILSTLTTDNSFRIMANMTNGQTYQVDYVYMIDRTSADILDISLDTLDYWFNVFRKIYEKTTPRYIIDELNSFDGSNIVNETISFEKTNFIEPTKNLFNKNDTISGFIDLNNGSITASSSYVTTNYYIEMKNGIAYTINTSRKVALYNTLKVIQIANSYDNPTQSLYTFTAPFDGYFRVSVENIYVNDCQIEKGSSFTTYTPFGIQIPSLYVDTKDVLKDKVILNLGDSIAQGNTGTSYTSYAHIIALEKRMKLYSKAVGGATLGDGSPDRSYIKLQYDEFKSENPTITPDYILIDGGTNDILYNTLGSIGSGYEDTWDETKTLGGLECLLENIKNDFPSAKVLFVFVHNMNTRDYASQITWYNGILSVLEKWSIPFVDIYKKGNLNTNIVAMRIYTDTGTHPTTEGYELFYVPMIKSKLYEI